MTISEMLKAAGYGHRRTRDSINTGKHEVFSLKTGAVIGLMDALEAAKFAETANG